jgi:flagellar basal-body rod modification protein FlgD
MSSLGKDDFLKLLTVQLQNQDPLSPMENENLIAQLTQFSSLEQLENINANLEANLELDLVLTQVLNNTAAASLIGKDVVADGNGISLEAEGETEVNFDLAETAERVEVVIRDQAGIVVKRLYGENLAQGRNSITWDGTGLEGDRAPAGDYTFTVEAYDGAGEEVGADTLQVGSITGIKFKDGEAHLVAGGREISISDVIEIVGREA